MRLSGLPKSPRSAMAWQVASKSGLCDGSRPAASRRLWQPLLLRMPDIRSAAGAVFRNESGRILASLIRISGSFDRAEEAVQEAFASALASWPVSGVPHNPGAWIMTAAHRKLIDAIRKERTRREKQDTLAYAAE